MKNKKIIDVFNLGKNTFNIYYNQLKNNKKVLKQYSEIIDANLSSINEHNNLLKNIAKDIDKDSTTDNPFYLLKKFEILLNLQCNYFEYFLENSRKSFENLKSSINKILEIIGDFLSKSQRLAINIKNSSEEFFEKYDKLMKSLEETEISVIDDYFKTNYNINIKRSKNKNKFTEQLVKESHIYENDFLLSESDIKDVIKKFITEYNCNMKEIKININKFNVDCSNDILDIIQVIKENCNNLVTLSNNASLDIYNYHNNNMNLENENMEYLNYEIKEEEIFKALKIDKYTLKIIQPQEKNLIEVENYIPKSKNKNKNNKNFNITGIDIYNIVEKIYNYKFETINKDKYDLSIEKEKLEVTKLTGYLLGYNFDTHELVKDVNMTENEFNYFVNYIFSKDIYIVQFLECLNNYRTTGKYEVSPDIFYRIKIIFDYAADYLLYNMNKSIYDFLIILSQTFYIIKDGKKYFLQQDLKNKKFFRSIEFWIYYLQDLINEELEKYEEEILKNNNYVISEQEKQGKLEEILSSKIMSFIASLNGFELEKEKVDIIILPFINKYILSSEVKDSILSIVEINVNK